MLPQLNQYAGLAQGLTQNFGANLLQPVFRGGELQARKRAAKAAYEQAAAAYRGAVLTALRNVADVLRSIEEDARAVAARTEQAQEATAALRIAQARYELGGVSQLAVLDAERQRLAAENERLQALANQLADAAALFQALGGGWPEGSDSAGAQGSDSAGNVPRK